MLNIQYDIDLDMQRRAYGTFITRSPFRQKIHYLITYHTSPILFIRGGRREMKVKITLKLLCYIGQLKKYEEAYLKSTFPLLFNQTVNSTHELPKHKTNN